MAKGYALVDANGEVFINTISSTERAAMVNALVTLFRTPVFQQTTDNQIEAMFARAVFPGQRIQPVNINAVTPARPHTETKQ